MTLALAFDALLAGALLWTGWRMLGTSHIDKAIVLFISFGLLMSLAWARLNAPDIGLAEAAIGAALTGALLLDTHGDTGGASDSGEGAARRTLPRLAAAACALAVAAAAWELPEATGGLRHAVDARLGESGVANPVTAVLLNFRGYDTLLEVAVLILALVAMLAPGLPRGAGGFSRREPVAESLGRAAAPLVVLAAAYLLWAGSSRPGGAFQAAAMLAGGAVLLHLAGLVPSWATPRTTLRIGIVAGFVLFLAVAGASIPGGALLQYPPAWSGILIVLIETGLTISLGLLLAGLLLFVSRP